MAENDSYQTPSPTPDNYNPNNNAENAGWHSPTQGGITTPIAPEGGMPAYPGNMGSGDPNDGIALPIAPEGGMPAYPGNMGSGDPNDGIALPIAPEGGPPVYPGNTCDSCITFPIFPSIPSPPVMNPRYGQVRFINASTNNFPVNFSIDGTPYASNSQFSNVSHYQEICDGFHTVSVNRTTGMQALLLQQTFPFIAGQKVTMVLMDAREGGLEMIQITDNGCNNLPAGYGCYRVANVSYSGSSFDVRMYNGDTVFRNVSFSQVTSYKRALAGNYTFYLTNTNFYGAIRELPVIIIGAITGTSPISRPLATGNVTIQAGQNTTTYIMGNTWSAYSLRMITVYD
ncbi:MAG: DUF4397 domain-containing protein [Lachnospiraceae bacterium]|jgi:hypothetical protein|nr:DUF4397 domain-containing protein [Lachnospiraceae bacterium]